MINWLNRTHVGDCRALMRRMIADGVRVNCVVTSPPYWALRDYGVAGQFGLERTWIRHVARMRGVFRLVGELLADDGTLWMNYGDCYAGAPGGWQGKNGDRASRTFTARIKNPKRGNGLKPKDLVGMPWRVALALQDDGWWLRSEIIWAKPNPMPESTKDRPTKAHEHLFLLARSEQYHYDANAIREPLSGGAKPRSGAHKPIAGIAIGPGSAINHAQSQFRNGHRYRGHVEDPRDSRGPGVNSRKYSGSGVGFGHGSDPLAKPRQKYNQSFDDAVTDVVHDRNARTVWTIPTQPFSGAHFATFPEDLVARCILAGSRPGDVIFDPFMGRGTVAQVATDLGRNFIGCELSQQYVDMHELRRTTTGMQI